MSQRLIGAALLAATASATTPALAAPCDDCNVLWLVIDTTRADYMGMYGNPDGNTPRLDQLAARGTTYEQAWTQGPDTMVSVSSYFTGRRNRNTDMDFTIFNRGADFHPMSEENTTVAEALASNGFKTVGMTANMVIAGGVKFDLNVQQGFQTWKKGTDREVADFGVQQLDALQDERFLLYLHMMGPHHPNSRAPGFESRRGTFSKSLPDAENHIYGEVNKGKRGLTDEEARYLRALYADALWEADAHMGRILDKLRATGLDKKTLVIVTSDHGEALGDIHNGKPVWGHGHALKEPLLHVPLLVAGPGLPKGAREETQMVELVDLAPTVTNYLGIPEDPNWKWEGDPVFGPGASEGTTSISDRGIPGKSNAGIRTLTHSVMWWEAANRWFYMDLTAGADAEEKHIQATTEHKRLQGILQDYMTTADPPTRQGDIAAPEGDTLEALRMLGYVDE